MFAKARFGKHAGEWLAFEVKTSLRSTAPGLSVRQAAGASAFAFDILEKAQLGVGMWVPSSGAEGGMQTWAEQILEDVTGSIDGYVIRNNKIALPTPKVTVDKWRP